MIYWLKVFFISYFIDVDTFFVVFLLRVLATTKNTSAVAGYTRVYSYFEKGCRKNMQAIIPKGNMGYDNYLLLLVSFSTRKHISTAFRTYSFKFLQRTVNLKPPTMPFGIVACTFSDNLSRNSCKYTKIQGPRFQRSYIIARDRKSDLHGASFLSSQKTNRILITRLICIQWKFTTPDLRNFAN